MSFEVVAARGSATNGICSNPFLEYAFKTVEYRITVTINTDGTWSYSDWRSTVPRRRSSTPGAATVESLHLEPGLTEALTDHRARRHAADRGDHGDRDPDDAATALSPRSPPAAPTRSSSGGRASSRTASACSRSALRTPSTRDFLVHVERVEPRALKLSAMTWDALCRDFRDYPGYRCRTSRWKTSRQRALAPTNSALVSVSGWRGRSAAKGTMSAMRVGGRVSSSTWSAR